ncbi:MAG: amino acid permease [Gemmatimonadota bacterium]
MTASATGILPRRLGTLAATGTIVGIMVGSGIFRIPSSVAGHLGSPGLFMLVWVVGGLLALAGALVVGEFTAMFPVPGGHYIQLREGTGEMSAFVFAWTTVFLLRPVALGALGLVFAAYLGTLIPVTAPHERLVAMSLIVVVSAVNYRSVAASGVIATLLSAAKVLALGAMVIGIFLVVPTSASSNTVAAAPSTLHGFGLALVTVMWTFSGWGSSTSIAGEVRNAERVMPRVLFGGVSFVVLLFLAINAAYLHALPMAEIAASKTVAADAATRAFGNVGGSLIALLVVVATFGSMHATMLSAPRMLFALGRDTPALRRLAAVHPEFETPGIAVAVTCVLGVVYLTTNTFEELAGAYVLGSWPFYVLTAVGLFRLRRLRPDLPRPFRTPGYPIVPGLFLTAALVMVINGVWADPVQALKGSALILSGVPVFWLMRPECRPWGRPAR